MYQADCVPVPGLGLELGLGFRLELHNETAQEDTMGMVHNGPGITREGPVLWKHNPIQSKRLEVNRRPASVTLLLLAYPGGRDRRICRQGREISVTEPFRSK